jgi:hypothetical protein
MVGIGLMGIGPVVRIAVVGIALAVVIVLVVGIALSLDHPGPHGEGETARGNSTPTCFARAGCEGSSARQRLTRLPARER